jgi:hypothetical protein
MATFIGKDGEVEFANKRLRNRISWQVDIIAQVIQQTPLAATNGYNKYRASFKDWQAIISCYLDEQGTDATIGTEATLLIKSGGIKPRFTGNAICVDIAPGATVNGVATINYIFQGSGELQEL